MISLKVSNYARLRRINWVYDQFILVFHLIIKVKQLRISLINNWVTTEDYLVGVLC